MPNRIIKESICTSDSVDALTWFEEVLFYRLIVNCDDFGRFDGRPAVIKSRLFPLKDNITAKSIDAAVHKLVSVELAVLYMFEGKPYLYLPSWDKHQQIRAKRSKYPAPSDGVISDDIKCNQVIANAPVIQSESNPNPNTNTKGKRATFTPPTLEEVEAYCKERGNSVDAKRFFDYFDANDWTDAKGKRVQSWKQKVITWESYQSEPKKATTELKDSMSDAEKFAAMQKMYASWEKKKLEKSGGAE